MQCKKNIKLFELLLLQVKNISKMQKKLQQSTYILCLYVFFVKKNYKTCLKDYKLLVNKTVQN